MRVLDRSLPLNYTRPTSGVHMSGRSQPLVAVSLFLLLLAAGMLARTSPLSASHATGLDPDAYGVDMDPFGVPANTATSLGSREPAVR